MTDAVDTRLGTSDELIVGEAVALDVRPASLILRAAGTLIDIALSVLVFFGFFLGLGFASQWDLDPALLAASAIAMLVVVLVVVPTVVETLTRGRSLGKLAVGARIVRDDGGAIGFRHAFIRALTGVLEFYFTAGGVAVFVGLAHPKGKRLGDLLAGTYSQHERVPRFTSTTFDIPVELSEWARAADAARLPDPLSRRIAAFLRQAGSMAPAARAQLATALTAETAGFVSPLPHDAEPELFLAAVAVLRREREHQAHVLSAERLQKLEPVLASVPHGFPVRRGVVPTTAAND